MKYYVVSAEQLEAHHAAQRDLYTCLPEERNSRRNRLNKAEAACRSREVYSVFAFDPDTGEQASYWEEYK